MPKLFGTDGIRGLANAELTPELAMSLGSAAGIVLKNKTNRSAVLIGKDTRISSGMLEAALTAGFCSVGLDVWQAGVIPTPAVAYLAQNMDVCAGAVISASHNPALDNGIKLINDQGFKLDNELETEIEKMIIENKFVETRPCGEGVGRIFTLDQAENMYSGHLQKTIEQELKGIRVILDCANGAAYCLAPKILRNMGAQVVSINDDPDGLNINMNCGSTHPQNLQKAVVKYKADLGLAFDGDADRVIAVDENGEIVNGDQIILICALALQEKARLGNQVVITVMSNLGLRQALKENNICVHETNVGDRYVLEKMLATNSILGGEQSGHIIFREYATTGDGILTALQLLQIVKKSGKKLSQLAARMKTYPQILVNLKVKDKTNWDKNPLIKEALSRGEQKLEGRGRLFVRASGTEPLLRVMAEGQNSKELEELVEEVACVIRSELL